MVQQSSKPHDFAADFDLRGVLCPTGLTGGAA